MVLLRWKQSQREQGQRKYQSLRTSLPQILSTYYGVLIATRGSDKRELEFGTMKLFVMQNPNKQEQQNDFSSI
jgi:hypothetical protein